MDGGVTDLHSSAHDIPWTPTGRFGHRHTYAENEDSMVQGDLSQKACLWGVWGNTNAMHGFCENRGDLRSVGRKRRGEGSL